MSPHPLSLYGLKVFAEFLSRMVRAWSCRGTQPRRLRHERGTAGRYRRLSGDCLEERRLLSSSSGASEPFFLAPADGDAMVVLGDAAEQQEWIVRIAVHENIARAPKLVEQFATEQVARVSAQHAGPNPAPFTITRHLGGDWFLASTDMRYSASHVRSTLKLIEGVVTVEPNTTWTSTDILPNDTRFAEQWSLHNTGQTGGTTDADIDLPSAWTSTTGDPNIVVAVFDSGIDYNHPDLRDRLWHNPGEVVGNGLDDDANGYVDDIIGIDTIQHDTDPLDLFGHGSHVSGTIAASWQNSIGIAGVAPNVSLMTLRILDQIGSGSLAAAVEALQYVITMRRDFGVNIAVANHSWGGALTSPALESSIAEAIQAGILTVAAAGNFAQNVDARPFYPASLPLPGIVSVASTDHNDRLSPTSNYGRVGVDLTAPGVSILSTEKNGGYGFRSGTSMAAPHVTGAAALIKSLYPLASPTQVARALMNGVDRIGAATDKTVTGGRLNVPAAIGAMEFIVASVTPQYDSTVSYPISDFDLLFSRDLGNAVPNPADLTVNGVPATEVQQISPRQLRYHFSQSPITTQGQQLLRLRGGAVSAGDASSLQEEFRTAFRYDAVPLQVVEVSPSPILIDAQTPAKVSIRWSEPIDVTSLNGTDLLLSHGSVTSVVLTEPNVVEFSLANLTVEEPLVWSFRAGAIRDPFGNRSLAAAGEIELDYGLATLPAPWITSDESPWIVQTASWQGSVPVNDIDSFSIDLNGDQQFAIHVAHSADSQFSVELVDSTGASIGQLAANPTAGNTVLQGITPATEESYQLRIALNSGVDGEYRIVTLVGTGVERETYATNDNNTLAAAENIDWGWIELTEDVNVLSMNGSADSDDWYQLHLSASDLLSIAVDGPAANGLFLSLVDSSGAVIVTKQGDNTGTISIDDYRSATDDGLFVRVSGVTVGRDYRVVFARNSTVESTDTTLTTRQGLNHQRHVVGTLGTIPTAPMDGTPIATDSVDTYTVDLQVGGSVILTTTTPGAEGLSQFAPENTLNPSLTLFRPDGLQIRFDDNSMPDGRNSRIVFSPTLTGRYRIDVKAVSGAGTYLLAIEGGNAAAISTAVIGSAPAPNDVVSGETSESVFVQFNMPLDRRTVQITDVLVDGQSSQSVIFEDAHIVRFNYSTPLAHGDHHIVIAANRVRDLAGHGNVAWEANFSVDRIAPTIVDFQTTVTDQDGLETLAIAVTFSESVRTAVDLSEAVSLVGLQRGPVHFESVSYDEDTATLSMLANHLSEDIYTLAILSDQGGWMDEVGNALDGEWNVEQGFPTGNMVAGGDFQWQHVVDDLLAELGGLSRLAPLGSGLTGTRSEVGSLHSMDDEDIIRWLPWSDSNTVVSVSPENPAAILSVTHGGHTITATEGGSAVILEIAAGPVGMDSITIRGDRATRYTLELYQGVDASALSESLQPVAIEFTAITPLQHKFVVVGRSTGSGPAVPDADLFQLDTANIAQSAIDLILAWEPADQDGFESWSGMIELRDSMGSLIGRLDQSTGVLMSQEQVLMWRDVPLGPAGMHELRVVTDLPGQYTLTGLSGAHLENDAIEGSSSERLNTSPIVAGFVDSRDHYAIDMVGGQNVNLEVVSWTAAQQPSVEDRLVPSIVVRDRRGVIVASALANGTSHVALSYTAVDDDRYFVEVVASSGVGEYLLSSALSLVESDFSGDHYLDCSDIYLLEEAIAAGSTDARWDINQDGTLNRHDLLAWITTRKMTGAGDANLDFVVDGADWNIWLSHRFTTGTSWCDGDFNGDRQVDAVDFALWDARRFTITR